jgi:hypothetical protein
MNIKVGDMVWVSIDGADQNFGYGEVAEVYTTSRGACFDFFCLVNGGKRFGLEDDIIDKPNARMVAKLSKSISDVNEVLKERR